MQKRVNLFKFCLIAFIVISVHKYIADSPFAKTYVAFADETVSSGSNIVCQIEGNVDNSYADMVEAELNLIPKELRTEFVESGYHIYVTDENLAKEYYGGGRYDRIYGVIFFDKDLILISGNEYSIKEATVHEFGHWFDQYLGYASNSRDFTMIYSSERARFSNAIRGRCSTQEIKEYFAEAFYVYIKAPQLLRQVAPQTYAYMNYYVQLVIMNEEKI